MSKLLSSSITIIICLWLAACSDSTDISSHLEKASEYVKSGKFSAAEIEIKNILSKENSNPSAIALKAQIFFEQGRLRDAYPLLNALKELAPDDLESRSRLSIIELAAGATEGAQENASFILSKNPTHVDALIVLAESQSPNSSIDKLSQQISSYPESAAREAALGILELKAGNPMEASKRFDTALGLDANLSAAHTGKFAILQAKGESAAAMAALKASADSSPARSSNRIRYAQYLIQSNETAQALEYLAKIIEIAPDYLPALGLYAELLVQNKEHELAREMGDKAFILDPLDPAAMRVRGVLLAVDGKPEDAAKQLEKTLEIYPNDTKARFQLARVYASINDFKQALPHLKILNSTLAGNFEVSSLLANAYLRTGDANGAAQTLEAYLKKDPESKETKLLLAEVRKAQGNNEGAISLYKELDAEIPNSPGLDFLSGSAQLQNGNRGEARTAFEKVLETEPNHIRAIEQLTRLDLQDGKPDQAILRLDKAIEASPESSGLYTIRGRVFHNMGNSDFTKSDLQTALSISPKNAAAYTLLSNVLMEEGNLDEALQVLQNAVEANPSDINSISGIATIYEQTDRTAEAISTYESILAIQPDFVPALNNLAYLISTTEGPTDKALGYAEKAHKAATDNPFFGDTLGWILYQRGEYKRARILLSSSAGKLTQIADVQYHLGAIDYMLGNLSDSKASLEKAISLDPNFSKSEDATALLAILNIDGSSADQASIITLEKSHKERAKDPIVNAKLGQAMLTKKNFASAISYFQSALNTVPDNRMAKIGLATAFANNGETKKATQIAQEIAKTTIDDSEVNLSLARIAYLSADYSWAASQYSEAARKDAKNPIIHAELAKALLATGYIERAIESNQRAISLTQDTKLASTNELLNYISSPSSTLQVELESTDDLPNQLARATKLYREGQIANAQASYESIVGKYPNQKQAILGLAKTLIKTDEGDLERAYNLADKVRSNDNRDVEGIAIQGIVRCIQNNHSQARRIFSGLRDDEWKQPSWKYYYGLSLMDSGDNENAKACFKYAVDRGTDENLNDKAKVALSKLEESR